MIAVASIVLAALVAAPAETATPPAASKTLTLTARSIALPGGPPVSMDYLAFDAANDRLWIPAGNTARIDVLNVKSGKMEGIEGLATVKRGERVAGVSSASAGDGLVFVGSRADSSICAYDAKTLAKKSCVTLESSPDGVLFVGTTHEIWVTTPHSSSIAILTHKAGALALSGALKIEGGPEGYAVDVERGLYYTNLEDKDQTAAVDVKTRKLIATWPSTCGEKGPRGIALDAQRRHLYVACTDGLRTLDAAKGGAVLGKIDTGAGADNIDALPAQGLVYVASGKEGKLSIVRASATGALELVATAQTTDGTRTAIIDAAGNAYLPDSKGGRLFVVELPEALRATK